MKVNPDTYGKLFVLIFWVMNMTVLGSYFSKVLGISPVLSSIVLNLTGVIFFFYYLSKVKFLYIFNFRSALPLFFITSFFAIVIFDAIYTLNYYLLIYLFTTITLMIVVFLLNRLRPYLVLRSFLKISDFIYISSIIVLVIYALDFESILSVDSHFLRKNNESAGDKQLIQFVLGLGQIFTGGSEVSVLGFEYSKYSSYFKEPYHLILFVYSWFFLKQAYHSQMRRDIDIFMITLLTFWSGSILALIMFFAFILYLINARTHYNNFKNNIVTIAFVCIMGALYLIFDGGLFINDILTTKHGSINSIISNWQRIFDSNLNSAGSFSVVSRGTDLNLSPNPLSIFFFWVGMIPLIYIIAPKSGYDRAVKYLIFIHLLAILKDPFHNFFSYNFFLVVLFIFYFESKPKKILSERIVY